MASAAPPLDRSAQTSTSPEEPRFLLRGVGWEAYEVLVEALERTGSHVRLTYDRGDLELMSPSPEHEDAKVGLRMAFEVAAKVYEVPIKGLGSTTYRSQALDRGLEPDECYYTRHWRQVSGKKRPDLSVDPPPDIAIEAEVTSSLMNRLGIYAALGVPEIWRFDGEVLRFLVLQDGGTYQVLDRSPTFPDLPPEEILQPIEQRVGMDDARWRRMFRGWVRQQIGRHGADVPDADADPA